MLDHWSLPLPCDVAISQGSRQSSSHFAISMVGGIENALEPLYFVMKMLEDMKMYSAFADAQNHLFHMRNAA